ncbi:hypothetical protein EcE24377A_2778 [Escherichia coli O139:H28 str. E24377A]|uniref:Uncharacterized protein n=1 Tax=Escherichia coli O139:H28 (strain E24377A / ETEC) TaxID=331111 RepID=A7ZPT8_ECO24|nr:hypothetical protein EcHS_A2630 [Escherichia coli HS]ABV17429.1 hypothetical protein EcE24377A_2778 [Escherichia coli O139:H28 str. E24377A]EGJ04052.1 hypothetical protein SSJG_00100 [Escherichia coli D9]
MSDAARTPYPNYAKLIHSIRRPDKTWQASHPAMCFN